jgi:hypothetical protein
MEYGSQGETEGSFQDNSYVSMETRPYSSCLEQNKDHSQPDSPFWRFSGFMSCKNSSYCWGTGKSSSLIQDVHVVPDAVHVGCWQRKPMEQLTVSEVRIAFGGEGFWEPQLGASLNISIASSLSVLFSFFRYRQVLGVATKVDRTVLSGESKSLRAYLDSQVSSTLTYSSWNRPSLKNPCLGFLRIFVESCISVPCVVRWLAGIQTGSTRLHLNYSGGCIDCCGPKTLHLNIRNSNSLSWLWREVLLETWIEVWKMEGPTSLSTL